MDCLGTGRETEPEFLAARGPSVIPFFKVRKWWRRGAIEPASPRIRVRVLCSQSITTPTNSVSASEWGQEASCVIPSGDDFRIGIVGSRINGRLGWCLRGGLRGILRESRRRSRTRNRPGIRKWPYRHAAHRKFLFQVRRGSKWQRGSTEPASPKIRRDARKITASRTGSRSRPKGERAAIGSRDQIIEWRHGKSRSGGESTYEQRPSCVRTSASSLRV